MMIFVIYTVPQLDCQRINLTSVGLVIPHEAAHNIDQLNFTIQHSRKVENIIYNTTSNETYSFPTIGGRVYTVKVVGRGLDGSWTPQPCTKTFNTREWIFKETFSFYLKFKNIY